MKYKLILMGFLSAILGLVSCKKENQENENSNSSVIQVANQITINQLPEELQKLKDGITEFNFIGITSNGVDCIYFVKDGDNFQIEFEAMAQEQIPFIEKLKQFANSSGYKFKMTTYGNKPQYTTEKNAPVIRIEINSNLTTSAEIGKTIENIIFKNTENTKYDVVP